MGECGLGKNSNGIWCGRLFGTGEADRERKRRLPGTEQIVQMAYEAYKAGAISSKEYGKIYATCMEYAYPK